MNTDRNERNETDGFQTVFQFEFNTVQLAVIALEVICWIAWLIC